LSAFRQPASTAETPAGLARRALGVLRYVPPRVLAFPALTVAVLGLFALLQAPALNEGSYLDPWIYSTLFRNFDYTYHTFVGYYWPSRLPWIIPGIVANWLLAPVGAFFLLHITFFVAGGLFAFLLARRYYGDAIALVSAGTVMLSPLFFDAHHNDYPDGGTITYLLGAACFAIGAFESRRRTLRLGLAGFFAAAAFGTQIYASVAILGLIMVYLVVVHVEKGLAGRLVRDAAAAAVGAFTLLVVCGSVARTHGGEFLFFMPSWRFAQAIDLSNWKRPGYAWMLREPQLLIPLFLLALVAVLLLRTRLPGWRTDSSLRFAAGSGLFLLYMVAVLGVWEFFGGADFLEVYYYFSLFLVPAALALPTVLWLLTRRAELRFSLGLTAGALVVAAIPVVLLYGPGVGPVDRPAFVLTAILMALGLVSVAAALFVPKGLAGVAAAAGLVFILGATGYAGAGGYTTRSVFGDTGSFAQRRAVLSLSDQFVDFMGRSGLNQGPIAPNFWYDGHKYPDLNGIQSAYLWGITFVGRDMPHVGPAVRRALATRKPPYLVLLCGTPSCSGGPAALEQAGFRLRLHAQTTIESNGERYWVKGYRLPQFKIVNLRTVWWSNSESAFATAPSGQQVGRWRLQAGLPLGWSSNDKLRPGGDFARLTTNAHMWNYEIQSPTTTLPAGSYRLYLRGSVRAGGLDLGVLNVGANSWINQQTYWYGQSGFKRGWMMTPFSLASPTKVQFVLSNWVPRDMVSQWELGELRLVRAG
jgi:hypothetical protein